MHRTLGTVCTCVGGETFRAEMYRTFPVFLPNLLNPGPPCFPIVAFVLVLVVVQTLASDARRCWMAPIAPFPRHHYGVVVLLLVMRSIVTVPGIQKLRTKVRLYRLRKVERFRTSLSFWFSSPCRTFVWSLILTTDTFTTLRFL